MSWLTGSTKAQCLAVSLRLGGKNHRSINHSERHGYFALTRSHSAEEHYAKTPRKGQQRLVQGFLFFSQAREHL